MPNIVLNGNSKKLILNGNEYLGSASSPSLTTKTITQNGTYTAASDNADGYSEVTVGVTPTLGNKTITQNGTYAAIDDDLQGYENVDVNVPATPLDNLSVTENGVYTPQSGHGYGEVTVNVSGGGITETIQPLFYFGKNSDDGTEGNINLPLQEIEGYFVDDSDHHIGYPNTYYYYNNSTNEIEIHRDFEGFVTFWVHGYSDSANKAEGALYINGTQVAYCKAYYGRSNAKSFFYSFKNGDVLAIQKPEDHGWSQFRVMVQIIGDNI